MASPAMFTSMNAPATFWVDPAVFPTPDSWITWKTTFTDYLDLLNVLNPSLDLTESIKIKLLRNHLGTEGQRQFDIHSLRHKTTLEEALNTIDKILGAVTNVYASRFTFSRISQQTGEPLEGFISRLIRAIRPCEYSKIPAKKLEDCMLIQQFIFGVRNEKIRESLLTEDASKLSWEKACEMARIKEQVRSQCELFPKSPQSVSVIKSSKPSAAFQPLGKCFRCGSTAHRANSLECPARTAKCSSCFKIGHFAKVCRTRSVHALEGVAVTVPEELPTAETIYALHSDEYAAAATASMSVKEPRLPRSDVRMIYFLSSTLRLPLEIELDSASPITVIPHSFYELHFKHLPVHPTVYKFDSYSNAPIGMKGFILLQLCVEYSPPASVAVYICNTDRKPLLGRNAMVALNLVPSIERMTIASVDVPLLHHKYPQLFADSIGRAVNVAHQIRLKSDAKPSSISQPRPIPLAKREAVSAAINLMLQNDIIEPITCSAWVHPLVAVFKKDGSVRLCTDLRALNEQIVVEKFILPNQDELLIKLAGAKFFSKLDIKSAFFHMPLTADSRSLTAFLTTEGLFQYKVLPMGLSSAPSAWQRFMTQSLSSCRGSIVYMDDICVFGRSKEEHDSNLHSVLSRLNQLNLRLNMNKCVFCVTEISFLGHIISDEGVRPNVQNTEAIANAPEPTSLLQLKRYLGLCSYYLSHLPNFATVVEPLRLLTRSNIPFEWSDTQREAFSRVKQMIVSVPVVSIFDESCSTFVSTDASDVGLGAVLSQMQQGQEKIIAYASRTLSGTERKYSASEKEALACVWACEKWHMYLFGRHFTLRTDHAALTTLLSQGSKGHRPLRISRWYARLLNYDFGIKYRRGSENQVADALSRLPLPIQTDTDDMNEFEMVAAIDDLTIHAVTRERLREHTQMDDELQQLKQYVSTGWPNVKNIADELKCYYPLREELSVIDDCIMRGSRLVPPSSLKREIMLCAHEGHPGITRTLHRASEWYWWPRMFSSIETLVNDCVPCQHADKSVKPIVAPVQPVEYPMRPWAKLAIDIMGPFATAPWNKRNILVANCYYSKWPEAHICGDVTSTTVIHWMKHLIARFGIPEEIVTDNGPQFISYEFKEFLRRQGIKHSRTVPYNPASNGMVERLNRSLKESIQALQLQGETWEDSVLQALFTYRTSHHRATGKTPAELMFGRALRTKLNAAHQPANEDKHTELLRRETYQKTYAKSAKTLKPGTFIRLKNQSHNKGQTSYSTPISIKRTLGPGTYELDNNKKVNQRHLFTGRLTRTVSLPSRTEQPVANPSNPRRSSRAPKSVDRFIYA